MTTDRPASPDEWITCPECGYVHWRGDPCPPRPKAPIALSAPRRRPPSPGARLMALWWRDLGHSAGEAGLRSSPLAIAHAAIFAWATHYAPRTPDAALRAILRGYAAIPLVNTTGRAR